MREDLDYDEAAELVARMRAAVKDEWAVTFRAHSGSEEGMGTDLKPSEAESSGDRGKNNRRGAWKV